MIIISRWSDVIYFDGAPVYTENAMGDLIEVPGIPRIIFANKKAIRQSEFYQAASNGMKPEISFDIRSIEYEGEQFLTYNDKDYPIIRTYDKGEIMELICEGAVNRGNA